MADVNGVQKQDEMDHLIKDNEKLQEVLRGYRILYFSPANFLHRLFNIDSIRIYDKSILALSKYGDDLYTKTKNRLIKDREYLTYAEQLKVLKERGLWDDKKEADLQDMRDKARKIMESRDDISKKMSEVQSPEESAKLQEESTNMLQTWADFYNTFAEVATLNFIYFQDTIEMQAQTAQRKGWLVSCLTKNEGEDKYDKNKRLWKNIDEIDEVLRRETIESLLSECVSYWDSYTKEESFFAGQPEELISDSAGVPQKN